MGFTLSEVYRCEPNEEALRLIREFALMVKWWAERAKAFPGGPYERLRKTHYKAWTERWPDWNRQLIHTSVNTAYSRLRLWKKPEERPKAVDLNISFAVLHPNTLKIVEGALRVSTIRGEYAHVKLMPKSPHQKRLLEQAGAGLWKLGQVVLTKHWAMIPFSADELDDATQKLVKELLEK